MDENRLREMFRRESLTKIRNYDELNRIAKKGEIVFAGSSLMENMRMNEILQSLGCHKTVYNRGLGGFTIDQYDEVLDVCVLDLQPSKVFINIGSNDLNIPGDTIGNMIRKLRALLERIQKALPSCEITMLAFYPVRPEEESWPAADGHIVRTKENVQRANEEMKKLAAELSLSFLDLNACLTDEDGYMKKELSTDQLHFSQAGYIPVVEALIPYL